MRTCDVAVIGLGIMGSAALANLVQAGIDARGFDPLIVGEQRGSSHGSCRVYRRFNFESPAYTELSDKAFKSWAELEQRTNAKVLITAPLVEAGPDGSALVRDSIQAAGKLARLVSGAKINASYPAFNLPPSWHAAVQDNAGIVLADVALRLYGEIAAAHIIRKSVSLNRNGPDIILTTNSGEKWATKKLIISAGAWVTDFEPRLKPYIEVTRQVVGWFEPSVPHKVTLGPFPLFILDSPQGLIYGFPDFENKGVKAANHRHGRKLDHADEGKQDARDHELEDVAKALASYIPSASGRIVSKEICLYTNTTKSDVDDSPAEEFIVDRLPDDSRVIIASPCSGHGFKFASAIGKILADMATNDSLRAPREFRITRFKTFL